MELRRQDKQVRNASWTQPYCLLTDLDSVRPPPRMRGLPQPLQAEAEAEAAGARAAPLRDDSVAGNNLQPDCSVPDANV